MFAKMIVSAGLFASSMCLAQDAGERVYREGGAAPEALACATCHGVDALGMDAAGFPRLAGLPAAYLAKQLYDLRDGSHFDPVMQPLARALTAEEITAVTAYLARLPSRTVPRIWRATVPEGVGETLAVNGDWSRSIPECVMCHGPGGVGVGDAFPPLAGQPESYLIGQLDAWRNGTRSNDPLDLMGHVARALTDEEIQAVSAYFASLVREDAQ